MTEFDKIYQEYFSHVYRYLHRLSGSGEIAEEMTSETFFKAMRSLSGFRGDCDLRVWLCQIAKNCYYTYLKTQKRIDPVDDLELLQISSQEDTLEEQCIKREDAAQIRAVLHHVTEPYKEVFMWRVFAELSFKQVGQIFGKSENWACVTYHRAKAMIKSKLEVKSNEK